MSETEREALLERLKDTLARHRDALLRTPGCTGVAIGLKQVGGEETDQLAIVVFVERKLANPPEEHRIPRQIEDHPTDVVEQEVLEFALTATDPFARFGELFSGISIATWDTPPGFGTIGCFINTTGDPANNIPAGDYLLTNQHVIANAVPPNHDTRVIQPTIQQMVPPLNYPCGNYTAGYRDALHDCAIADVAFGRTFTNEVPNYPWRPGNRTIRGVAAAAPGDAVYKFGATSKFTEGVVALVNYTPPNLNFQNVILIRSTGGTNAIWVATGDSGSVTIRQSDDRAVGLNFAGSPNAIIQNPPVLPAYPAYYRGFAYDLQTQMNRFAAAGGAVTLA